MNNNHSNKVIQFLHPGVEHSPEKVIEIWQNITNQVFEQGLGLMLECGGY